MHKTINVLVVRHAERAHLCQESEDELTQHGKDSVRKLQSFAREAGLEFVAAWHAPTGPARATARLLAPQLIGKSIATLGPKPDAIDLATVLPDLATFADDGKAIALVGHEPNISRLVAKLSGRDCRWLDAGEGVCVIGSLEELRVGGGRVAWASRRIDESELLKEKLQSKFAVSSFLAGFFIAALVELVKDPEKLRPQFVDQLTAWTRVVAAICFTLALALLLAAVYTYDRLSMPRQFWKPMPEGSKPKADDHSQFAHDFRLNGALYAYMIRTWRFALTPGVWFGILGFLALLVPNYDRCSGQALIAGGLLAIVVGLVVLRWSRGALAID
jgi:phosphohistidine phosphatase SixA